MISFFTDSPELHQNYLAKRGKSLASRLQLFPYCDLPELSTVPVGVSIFAAIDRISPLQREAVTAIWDQLAKAGQRVLNHPKRSWRRYRLLRNLHELGRNQFEVYQISELSKLKRFPVFVREANQHTGSLTPLLNSRSELKNALRELISRGYRTSFLMIVEYCDTKDSTGLIRKYSAFKVGDVVLAKNLMFSSDWHVKDHSKLADKDTPEALVQEQQEYIRTNPHEAWIREIFELAEINYGRIDYGFANGMPQVWEVNTDPTIQARPAAKRRPSSKKYRSIRKLGQDFFHEQFRAALCKLDDVETEAPEICVQLDGLCLQRLKAEQKFEALSGTINRRVGNFIDSVEVQRLKPWLAPLATKLAPRLSQIVRLRPR